MRSVSSSPNTLIIHHTNGPNIVVRILWFLVLGLWLGTIATLVGYTLCVSVIGLPIGLLLFHKLPGIMTLRPITTSTRISEMDGMRAVEIGRRTPQLALPLRAVYFAVIGWWLTAFWLALAWLLVAVWPLTLGLSLGAAFMMFDRVPAVLTLHRR